MTKVLCAAIECIHNKNDRCTVKNLCLNWCSVMTVWDGRQEFFRCKQYELSEESQRLAKQIKDIMEGKINAD